MTAVIFSSEQFGEQLIPELPGLLRYARTLVRDQAGAEDLVQDTIVRALEKSASFRGEASLATWLHRVLHNIAIDRGRVPDSDAYGADVGDFDRFELLWQDDSYSVDAAVVVERAALRERLQDALLRIPLPYRSAVVLHDSEGLTVAEVAGIQHVSLPAAKQRLRRGRMMLVSLLADERRLEIDPDVPLRCWDARSRVSDYIDAELPQRDRQLLEAHLGTCPTCPPLYAGLVGAREALGRARDPDAVVPAGLAARIRSIIVADGEPSLR